MRAAVLIALVAAALAGCGSSGGTRPDPPAGAPVFLRWEPVTQTELGEPIGSASAYTLEYWTDEDPTVRSTRFPGFLSTVRLTLPRASWRFRLRAEHPIYGNSDFSPVVGRDTRAP